MALDLFWLAQAAGPWLMDDERTAVRDAIRDGAATPAEEMLIVRHPALSNEATPLGGDDDTHRLFGAVNGAGRRSEQIDPPRPH